MIIGDTIWQIKKAGESLRTKNEHMKYLFAFLVFAYSNASSQTNNMMIRIAEIEIDSNYLEAYKAILQEEAKTSVQLEPGVIAIFPMYQRDHPIQIRILEIYTNKEAYEAHLKTPHFLKYKSGTQQMVKQLKLVEMASLNAATMADLFRKMKQ
jgi:quinol monooxygenase YgiN